MNAEEEQDDYKSKSQIKREMLELRKMGETLVHLGAAALAKIPLDDELGAAIDLARNINKKKDGYRRQLQLIGKMLRSRDVQPIQLALQKLKSHHQESTTKFHKLEKLRDKLINGGDDEIQATLEQYPWLERQKLRQLLRQVKKEQDLDKPPAAARELFKYLKSELDKEQ